MEGRHQSDPTGLEALRLATTGWAGDLADDVRFALRSFGRSPGFTAAVLLTLAIALGGTTAIFGAMYGVYQAALPFENADRLLRLRSFATSASGGERVYNMPDRDALAIRETSGTLSEVVMMRGYDLALVGGELAERIRAVEVSEGWVGTLGVEPLLGRTFTREEEASGRDARVALLSHGLWQDRLGGDPSLIGSTIRLDEGVLTVVGVMPPGFRYPYDAELWTPLRPDPTNHTGHDLNVVARMAPGVTIEEVRADLARVFDRIGEQAPGTVIDDGIHVATLRADFIREDGRVVQALLVAVAFLLLLACVNVANLLTARFLARSRELGVRAALGAGRSRQFRQLLTETVLLFGAGGLLGLIVASWMSDTLQILVPNVLRDQLGLGAGVGATVVLFAVGVSVLAGLAFGFAAAAKAQRMDLFSALYGGTRGSTTSRGRLQDGLVIAELALSVVLLVGAGIMADHFRRLRTADLGFDVEGLYTLRVPVQQDRYASAQARGDLVRRLEEGMTALPGVTSVGFTSVNPLCCGDWGASIEVEGRPRSPDDPPLIIHHRYATPDFFDAMGIPLVRGSGFDPSDGPDAPPTVVIDEAMANRLWPGDDPLGQRVRLAQGEREWRTVVGVVADTYMEGDYTEAWFLPFHQQPLGRSNEDLHVMLRVRSPTAVDAARAAIAEVDPNLPTYEVAAMSALRDDLIAQDRLGSLVSASFAAFGLLLAAFGLHGLLAYLVSLRSREIGTRIALGASRGSILEMVLRQAGRLLAGGVAIGIVAALALDSFLRRAVLETELVSVWLILLPLLAFLTVVAGVAALLPAYRATRIDPATAFRAD